MAPDIWKEQSAFKTLGTTNQPTQKIILDSLTLEGKSSTLLWNIRNH